MPPTKALRRGDIGKAFTGMEVIFLGTGTSQGVPIIAHPEDIGPDLANPKNWRTRSSIHVVMGGHHIQVDAGPEFRLQCIHNDIRQVDTFILTHGHADHILGMDDLRRFNDLREGRALPVYSTAHGIERVRTIFPYAIGERPVVRGYAAFLPQVMPEVLELPGGVVRAFLLPHGRIETLGLVFEEAGTGKRFAYFNDCKDVVPEARECARGVEAVALDALRFREHGSHMSIEEALAVAKDLQPAQSYFTHMTFEIDFDAFSPQLPAYVSLAYDGLRLQL
ncbi:MAG: MBL fold metallo-hydrolase [Opitutales bacterium]